MSTTTKPVITPATAALAAKLGLSEFETELLAGSLEALPPVIAGQHADKDAESNAAFDHYLGLEDVLSSCMVFTNGISGRRCSAAAYMTVFGYNAFDAAFELIGVDRFNRADWIRIVAYYRHNWNLSPVLAQLAAAIARKVGLPSPLEKDAATVAFYAGSAE